MLTAVNASSVHRGSLAATDNVRRVDDVEAFDFLARQFAKSSEISGWIVTAPNEAV